MWKFLTVVCVATAILGLGILAAELRGTEVFEKADWFYLSYICLVGSVLFNSLEKIIK